jgi:hypothetical protein
MPPPPPGVHDYVAFDAPDEHRTWLFDLTFLTSSWECIYGRGCPGVLTGPAPEMEQGCCSYGAHMIDDDDAAAVLAAASRLDGTHWQHHRLARRRGGPLRRRPDGTQVTRLAGDACIFLNRPDFAGGAGCALHRAALAAGERPMDWKPDVCWQLPLRLVEHTDESGHVTSTVRAWERRDWGAGGHEFHWWCTEVTGAAEAYGGRHPVYLALRDEIVELVGQWAYDRLCECIEARTGGQLVSLGSRKLRRRERA